MQSPTYKLGLLFQDFERLRAEEGLRFPLTPAFHSPIELETKVKQRLNKGLRTFHNYREGPYLGLHLVESDYYYDTVSQHEIGTPKQRP